MEDLVFIMEELTLNCFAADSQGHVPSLPPCFLGGFIPELLKLANYALQLLKPV